MDRQQDVIRRITAHVVADMSGLKLCRDCRWSSRTRLERLLGIFCTARCLHPSSFEPERIDPVSGAIEGDEFSYCSTQRMHSSDICGFEGRLWEK